MRVNANNEPAMIPPAPDFRDRTVGLIMFGVIEMLLGCACALFIPMMMFGQMMTAQATGGQTDLRLVLPSIVMYAILAVMFIWLGIGSSRCRRWARSLTLIMAWTWLLTGVIGMIFMMVFMPKMLETVPAGPAKLVASAVIVMMMFFIFILLPASFVLFYRSPHVKATCERRDPAPNWTDACPPPVLTLSLCFGFGAVTMAPMLLTQRCVMPFFGVLLSGLPGFVAYILMMAVCAYLAWGLYRLQPAAWWISTASMVVLPLSAMITFMRVDMMEMYRLMGYPTDQIEQIKNFNFLTPGMMVWFSSVFTVACVGYMVWIKRHFKRAVGNS
jgi:hypothetical protein